MIGKEDCSSYGTETKVETFLRPSQNSAKFQNKIHLIRLEILVKDCPLKRLLLLTEYLLNQKVISRAKQSSLRAFHMGSFFISTVPNLPSTAIFC